MTDQARIEQMLALVLELAQGNLAARLEPSISSDPLDGVIEGLNMLAEELSASTSALTRSEANFRSLLQRSPDAILVYHEQRFLYVNEAARVLLRYETEQALLSESPERLLRFEADPGAFERLRDVSGSLPPPAAREARLFDRHGDPLDVEVSLMSVDFDGERALLAVLRDISARKQLTAKVMDMDRMIAVGTLAAGVGHEINNPLAYVISNLDFALEQLEGTLPEERGTAVIEALAEAREGAERIRRIVRDLKTFSRAQEPAEETVELKPVIESSINMAFNEIRHRAQLVRHYGPTPKVQGSAARLGQVFLNLLVNAAQAIPEGSARTNTITIRTSTVSGCARVEISDTGSGIEPRFLSRLFDPFFTTKPVGEGTGLGLFICKRIVLQHRGEMHVESVERHGTTFSITLPPAVREEALASTRRPTTQPPARRSRVLVVDDEPAVGRGLRRALSREIDVAVATDAREALTQLQNGADYDVIVCDIMMPEMTGVELYAALEAARPDLAERMLFFTGGAFTPSAQQFVSSMAGRCLDKPLDLDEVRRRVAEMSGQ